MPSARTLIALLVAAPWVALAIVRTAGLDAGWPLVGIVAFTPYAAAASFVPVLVAVVLRRRLVALVALAAAVLLGVAIVPRALGGPDGAASGRTVTVMALNLHAGKADARVVLERVRDREVDVLCLEELTVGEVLRLDAAGVTAELGHWVLQPASYGYGGGIMARGRVVDAGPGGPEVELPGTRVPLSAQAVAPGGEAVQPIADVTLDGMRTPLRVQAVHTTHPAHGRVARWERGLASLPSARAEGAPDILAGDFNATLDHREFRDLLDRGWTDAANEVGDGLVRTWPVGRHGGPHVAIDHVLVRPGIAVRSFEAVDVPGSDHRAVIARLELP